MAIFVLTTLTGGLTGGEDRDETANLATQPYRNHAALSPAQIRSSTRVNHGTFRTGNPTTINSGLMAVGGLGKKSRVAGTNVVTNTTGGTDTDIHRLGTAICKTGQRFAGQVAFMIKGYTSTIAGSASNALGMGSDRAGVKKGTQPLETIRTNLITTAIRANSLQRFQLTNLGQPLWAGTGTTNHIPDNSSQSMGTDHAGTNYISRSTPGRITFRVGSKLTNKSYSAKNG